MNEERWASFWLAVVVCSMAAAWFFLAMIRPAPVYGQEHRGHPPQDLELHRKFYSNWFMPDAPHVSCCHDQDCFPAQSKFVDGSWYARKTDEEEWTKIPASKIEMNRDTPDGRSHMCGRQQWEKGEYTVFCFLPGSGG